MARPYPLDVVVSQRPMTAEEEKVFLAAFKEFIEELVRQELESQLTEKGRFLGHESNPAS